MDPSATDSPSVSASRWRWRTRITVLVLAVLGLYLLTAYLILPQAWRRYMHRHPGLDDVPNITQTQDGIPGDPLNVALVGSEAEVRRAMTAAGWDVADPLGLRSDLKIAADTVLRRPDDDAPVSNLYLFGRKEDFAFEQPVGGDPRRRHHVRFWRAPKPAADGRPTWLGSVTYDERVGFSHTTGQITHHIAPDVDAEREHLIATLKRSGELSSTDYINGFHTLRDGRNGGGDPWHTDGRLAVAVIVPAAH
jgi:hypothetical protein